MSDGRYKCVEVEGFLQELAVWVEQVATLQIHLLVAAHDENLGACLLFMYVFLEVSSLHLGHHDVGYHQRDRRCVLFKHAHSGLAIASYQQRISVLLEDVYEHRLDVGIIFNQEDGLGASWNGGVDLFR